jgi:hypothetical protein
MPGLRLRRTQGFLPQQQLLVSKGLNGPFKTMLSRYKNQTENGLMACSRTDFRAPFQARVDSLSQFFSVVASDLGLPRVDAGAVRQVWDRIAPGGWEG